MGLLKNWREFEHQASLNWAMAARAEDDGKLELAERLAAVARENDRLAMASRNGLVVRVT